MSTQEPAIAHAITAMGTGLGPDVLAACRALFDEEQNAQGVAPAAADIAYGPDVRHRLDLYGNSDGAPKPVLLFVHGGGFVAGDKGGKQPGDWPNAAVGMMAARWGMIGAVMNYRLAPDHSWPAGGQDVGAAIDWLRAHVADHGGDPSRIVVLGTSAGSVHVAGFLRLRPDHGDLVRGAILLSGLYGYTPLDPKDERYYGADGYDDMMPREAVAATTLPLLLACAQFDPARFQAEFLGLMTERLERHGAMPRSVTLSGHNHYTMAMHLGTADSRLADEIARFVKDIA